MKIDELFREKIKGNQGSIPTSQSKNEVLDVLTRSSDSRRWKGLNLLLFGALIAIVLCIINGSIFKQAPLSHQVNISENFKRERVVDESTVERVAAKKLPSLFFEEEGTSEVVDTQKALFSKKESVSVLDDSFLLTDSNTHQDYVAVIKLDAKLGSLKGQRENELKPWIRRNYFGQSAFSFILKSMISPLSTEWFKAAPLESSLHQESLIYGASFDVASERSFGRFGIQAGIGVDHFVYQFNYNHVNELYQERADTSFVRYFTNLIIVTDSTFNGEQWEYTYSEVYQPDSVLVDSTFVRERLIKKNQVNGQWTISSLSIPINVRYRIINLGAQSSLHLIAGARYQKLIKRSGSYLDPKTNRLVSSEAQDFARAHRVLFNLELEFRTRINDHLALSAGVVWRGGGQSRVGNYNYLTSNIGVGVGLIWTPNIASFK
jgi:hypothetical protein